MADPIDADGTSVALIPPGYTFPPRNSTEIVPIGNVRTVDPRRPRQRATRQARPGAQKRRGGRPKKNSLRGVYSRVKKRLAGRRFGKRASTNAEVGTAAKRRKYVYLTLGSVTVACIFGITSAFASDLALQRYISRAPTVRLAVHAGIAIAFWWIGGTSLLSPMWGQIFKLMAMTHAVSGVLIVGTDVANAATPVTPAGGG